MKIRQHCSWDLLPIIIVFTILLSCTFATAQTQTAKRTAADREHIFGAAGMLSFPYGEFGEKYDTGYGLHVMVDYPWISILNLTADLGWNHFPDGNDKQGVDVWEGSLGCKLAFGWFFMGGEAGYYTQVRDWSFVPTWGLKFGQFEFSMRTKAVGGGSWSGMRVGWYF